MDNNFKLLRKSQGLTQEALAEKIGVNPITVSQWERGKYSPTASNVPKVAKALGITPEQLLAIFYNKGQTNQIFLIYKGGDLYRTIIDYRCLFRSCRCS